MMKRKRDTENDVSGQSKRVKDTNDNFTETLKFCGYIIGEEDSSNELEVDQAIFLKDLTKKLSTDNIRSKFLEGLDNLSEDEVKFKWSLLPTVTALSCKTARNACQDSLFHLLLNIIPLQEKVSRLLLEKLAEFAICEGNEAKDTKEGKSLSCMILLQFRWLNELVNSASLSSQLFNICQEAPLEVQRDIISLLPSIVSEADHTEIANNLTNLLQEKPNLNVTILNTLSNLIIDSSTLYIVRKEVLKALTNAKFEDLPGIIRFVLIDLKQEHMQETIFELRNNLDFTPQFDPIFSSTPLSASKQNEQNIGNLIINSVKLSLQVQKQLCGSWIKVLEEIQAPRKFKPFDVFVLLILYPLSNPQKVENLIKKKIKSGELNEELLNKTFRMHHHTLKEYVSYVIKMAMTLLKSNDTSISSFANSLYVKTFLWFDVLIRQEVVGNLVIHVTNGTFLEINTALDTLLSLVKHHASKMLSFSVFLKSLIDYFDTLSLCQIRKVYEMISFLCYWGQRDDVGLEDDMQIVIRKQLMHKNPRYQKMGIIGALVAAKIICIGSMEKESPGISDCSDESDPCAKAVALLSLVQTSVVNFPDAEALFYDELCRIISEGPHTDAIEYWIDNHIIVAFEESYIVDVSPEMNIPNDSKLMFGFDDDSIALNLHATLKGNMNKSGKEKLFLNKSLTRDSIDYENHQLETTNSRLKILMDLYYQSLKYEASQGSKVKQCSYVVLVSMFRLLQVRKQKQDGCLAAIDALLSCPILVPELPHPRYAVLPIQQKHFVLNSIFLCINWIRENINAFSSSKEAETQLSIVLRLQLLVKLEELLFKYLQDASSYIPPLAHFDCEGLNVPCFKMPPKKKKIVKKKPGKKGKSKASDSSPDSTVNKTKDKSLSLIDDSDADDTNQLDAKVVNRIKNKLQSYYREFDVNVFKLFHLGITFKEPCDPFANEKDRELALHPTELRMFLEDLLIKIRHSLCSSILSQLRSSQQVGFSNLDLLTKTEGLISNCIEIFPAICHLLEESANYFRSITAESDDIVDPLILMSESSQKISYCMMLMFNILHYFFSWKGFHLTDNLPQLKNCVRIFASRERELADDTSIQNLICYTVEYFAKFDDALITITCASALIELLENVVSFSERVEPKKQVSEVAKTFLRKSWPELDKKLKASETSKSIQLILEAYLKYSNDVLKSLEYLSNEAVPKFLNDAAESENEQELNTLNKTTLPSYFKIMLRNLAEERKTYYIGKSNIQREDLEPWVRAIKVFHSLINLIKTNDSRYVIRASLQYGRQFIHVFLKHGMPLLDKYFSSEQEDILLLLKNLQMSTRYMQHVCSHSKVLKDVTLTCQVPFVKKTLEQFVYRVKVMLAVNKCEKAFWIGNLKNRDLKGTEISSQALMMNEDDEESLPSSDENEGNEEEQNDENNDHDDDKASVSSVPNSLANSDSE